jgi:thiol-disulfide isomerase/thioredoxin
MKNLRLILVFVTFTITLSACSTPKQTDSDSDITNTVVPTVVTTTIAGDEMTEPTIIPSGIYTDYSQSGVTASAGKRQVLFFYASWCPSCRDHDANLQASVSDIPSDVAIFKLNYDNEIALRQKYGVTLQHTFVEIDDAGNELEQWNSLYKDDDLASILTHL